MTINLFDFDFSRWGIILLNLLPAFINFGIFIYVSFFLPKNKSNFAFSVFLLLDGLWQSGEGFMRLSSTMENAYEWFRISGVFSVFVIPFGILFILNYSNAFKKISNTFLFLTLFLPSIICLLFITARLDSYTMLKSDQWYWISNPNPTIITSLLYIWVSVQAILMLIFLWIGYKRTRKAENKGKPLLLLALGFTIPVIGGIIGEAIFPLALGLDDIPLVTPLFTLFSISSLVAIKKYKLFDYSPLHQWDNIVQEMSEGLLIVNNEDEIMYANNGFCELTGYDFREINGKVAYELFFENQGLQNFMKSRISERKEKKSNKYEVILKTKSAEKIWVSISGSPYIDNSGNVVGSIGILTNINNLKKAETRFRALVENVGDIISMVDKNGKVIYVSPALEKVTGFSEKDMKGKEGFTIMHPDYQEESKRILEEVLLKPGVTIPRVSRFLHKKGHYVWVEGTVTNLLDDEAIGAIVSNYRDISKRKEAEEKVERNEKRYRSIVENGADVVVILSSEGNPIYVSPNVERVLGYGEEEALKINMFEIIYPEDIPQVMKVLETALLNPGISIPGYTGRMRHKDGSWRWYESTVTNMLHDPYINGIIDNFREVTERKIGEELREFDSNNLKALINNTNDLMWSVDRDFKLITSNHAFNELVKMMSGFEIYTGCDVLKTGFSVEQNKRFRELYERAFLGQSFTIIEYTNVPSDFWSEISFYPIQKGDEIIGTACFSHNITERKIFERELEKNTNELIATKNALEYNESRLKQAQTIAHVGNWELNFETNISVWSDEAYSIYGLSPHENELSYESWLSFIHPEDLAAVKKEIRKARISLADITFYHRIIRKDGAVRHILSENKFEFNSEGHPIGLYGIVRDITEKKLAEEKLLRSEKIYKTIASSISGSVIYMIDLDYNYLFVEGDMLEKFGYAKDKLLGSNAKKVSVGERFNITQNDLERVLGGQYFAIESVLNGYDVITKFIPLHDESNKVYAALMVTIDITQVKKSQHEIAELNHELENKVIDRTSQLENANKELESFSYSVSHDLRSPLRAVNGYTKILHSEYSDKLDEEGNRLLDKILSNTKRMGELIDELLAFSRLGKKKITKNDFSMNEMVISVIEELKNLEGIRDIEIELTELPDIYADHSTIRQVWINLISNAFKYTQLKPKAVIKIGSEVIEDELIYYIKDNGAGFDMTYKDKLFGVFQRLHSEEEFEGIGVGLAIVKRIVLKHDGRIWAEGKQDEGATFYFSLN